MRAGMVKHPPSTRDPREAEMVRVVSAASLAWDGQLDRVDRFSLPLLPSGTQTHDRANPAMTSQLFLEQVASDYRRVASCSLDLRETEARRNTREGATALERAGVASRPVAPLAIGQYLAACAAAGDLTRLLAPWLSPADDTGPRYAAAFGDVLGPMIQAALDLPHTATTIALPEWAGKVGKAWCEKFLATGAEILNHPALLTRSQTEGRAMMTSRQSSVDVSRTTNEIIALAEAFRRVVDVRVSETADQPKIDLVLSGDPLSREEFDRFTSSTQNIAASVTILSS